MPPASMVPTRPYLVQQDRKDLRESSAPTPVTSSEAIVLPDTGAAGVAAMCLDGLRAAVESRASMPPQEAVSRYVEAVSDQHGTRLNTLLDRTGLSGHDPITGAEARQQLGVTSQRTHQIVQQLRHRPNRARLPARIWMPQVDDAVHHGWLDHYTAAGIAGTLTAFEHSASN